MMNRLINFGLVVMLCSFVGTSNVIMGQIIAAGTHHSIFGCSSATASSVGRNTYGQLGDGSTTSKSTPVQSTGLTGISAVAGGWNHTLYLKSNGTVWAAGRNNYGQLGDGTMIDRSTPVQVNGLSGITAVAAGGQHSLFLRNDGTVWAVGYNAFGRLGDGTTVDKSTAVQVSGLTGITAVAGGDNYSVFLKNDGTVWSVGNNLNGQLGDGTSGLGTEKTTAVQVIGLSGITTLAAGGDNLHSLFVKSNGTVWAVGRNNFGQLGDGTTVSKSTAIQVSGLSGISAAAVGYEYSLFLKNDGTVWSVGNNFYGQLGDGTTSNKTSAVQVNGVTAVSAVAAGNSHSLFQKNDGTVKAVGRNDYGQLGDGTTANKTTAVQLSGLCGSVGIKYLEIRQHISVYPNPCNEVLYVEVNDFMNTTAEIFDIQGQHLQSVALQSNTTAVQINALSRGIYFVKIKIGDGLIVNKFVKD
jgi:alpha-tubulin suppressor-like RCC1 family protein